MFFYVLDWWMQMDRQDNHVKKKKKKKTNLKERYTFQGEAKQHTLDNDIDLWATDGSQPEFYDFHSSTFDIDRKKERGPHTHTRQRSTNVCFPANGCTSKTHPITIRNQNRVHTHRYNVEYVHTQTKAQRRTFFFSIFCQRLLLLF